MACIDLDLAHSYLPQPESAVDYALLPMQLRFEDGGAYALLGPSGCGKSTMLNLISGLLQPSQGKVLFDGRNVTEATPQQRNIAQVFQFPVVYDTMTVAQNMAFPLKNRGMSAQQVRARVHSVAEMLELDGLLQRRAAGLSADLKQIISLARGLVRADVCAVLFDEPLTVIDPHFKWKLRRKLKYIHQELKLTLIYVTHDQVEALTFADEIVVMAQGKAVQTGTAKDLFERPAHTFVGNFIGSPGMNFLPVLSHGTHIDLLGKSLAVTAPLPLGQLLLGIRPESIKLALKNSATATPVQVVRVQDLGAGFLLSCQAGEKALKVRLAPEAAIPAAGDVIDLELVGNNTRFYQNELLVA